MKPVKQEFFNDTDRGVYSDCQRAVIASLLEMPISEVPHFMQEAEGRYQTYWLLVFSFLKKLGFTAITVNRDTILGIRNLHYFVTGRSPRDHNKFHVVVGLNGEIVHDPHPDNTGLADPTHDWTYRIIVKLC